MVFVYPFPYFSVNFLDNFLMISNFISFLIQWFYHKISKLSFRFFLKLHKTNKLLLPILFRKCLILCFSLTVVFYILSPFIFHSIHISAFSEKYSRFAISSSCLSLRQELEHVLTIQFSYRRILDNPKQLILKPFVP